MTKYLTKYITKYSESLYLVLIILIGTYLRFNHIKDIGLEGADVFYYWEKSYEWFKGLIHPTEHYRPIIYLLYSTAFKIFGANDYAIKILNSSFDLLHLIVIYLLAKNLTFSKLARLSIVTICSLSLVLIEHSRSELVHTLSLFFMTLTFYFFSRNFNSNSNFNYNFNYKSNLLLAGASLACCFNTHPELGFVLPFLGIYLLLDQSSIKQKFINNFLLILGFLLINFLLLYYCGISESIESFGQTTKRQFIPVNENWFIYFKNLTINFWQGSFGLVALVIYLSTFTFGLKNIKTAIRNRNSLFILMISCLPIIYLIMYAVIFKRTALPRLYIPLLAFILISIYSALETFFNNKRMVKLFCSILVLLCFIFPDGFEYKIRNSPSIHKSLSKEISHILNPELPYLILPITAVISHTPLNKKVYLNGQGHYIFQHPKNTIEAIKDFQQVIIWKSNSDFFKLIASSSKEEIQNNPHLNFLKENVLKNKYNFADYKHLKLKKIKKLINYSFQDEYQAYEKILLNHHYKLIYDSEIVSVFFKSP